MPIAEITHDFAAIPDAVTARYAADLANMEPETVPVEAEVERSATYLFRTRARTTGVFRIAIPGMSAKEQMDDKLAPQLRKVYERKYGKAGLKRFETLRDAVGGPVGADSGEHEPRALRGLRGLLEAALPLGRHPLPEHGSGPDRPRPV